MDMVPVTNVKYSFGGDIQGNKYLIYSGTLVSPAIIKNKEMPANSVVFFAGDEELSHLLSTDIHNHVSTGLYSTRNSIDKRINEIKFEVSNNNNRYKNDMFVPVSFNNIDNKKFWEKMSYGKLFPIYMILRRYVVRGQDNLGLYEFYYKNNVLVSSVSQNRIAQLLGYNDKGEVRNYLKKLEVVGFIKIVPWHTKDRTKRNIYILGNVNNETEMWFIDKA